MEKRIRENISLPANELNCHIISNIHKKIEQKYLNTCNIDHGYIFHISDDVKIISNHVSNVSTDVVFTVEFGVKMFKPEQDIKIVGNVFMISVYGAFLETIHKMKVLIPAKKLALSGYKYDQNTNTFASFGDKISKGDNLEVTLEMVKYEKGAFNCIGGL
jgi:DNA-directed RNA polymerase subunit E'/Rpb7